MTLVRFDNVTLEYGEQVLLRDAELSVEPGERVCLVGRNGAGKTSSFKLITGEIEPDRGVVERNAGLRVATLGQSLPAALESTVHDVVRGGLEEIENWRNEYQSLLDTELAATGLKRLETLQHQIDAAGGWHLEQRVAAIISELGLPAMQRMSDLSAGWRRRVGLARALIGKPELLLLDEPTNHLDFSTVEWLEHRILGYQGAVLFISHDRRFVTRLATRIVELDRGRLQSWPGNYQKFIDYRDKALADETTRNALFDKRLAEEEAWIREGIKARRTRNQGRVRALVAMREQYAQRLTLERSANIRIDTADPSGRKVIELKNVAQRYDGHTLFRGLSLNVMRGERVGLVGNNGVGKSTLLRIMLGEQQPTEGVAKQGSNLEIGYFDPVNAVLPPDQTVADFVGEGREFIDVAGKSRHIISYLGSFLFSAKRARTRIGSLSGGERNRVLLAQVLARASNLLVLDEPTNDLDVETLEVLEERLVQYDGTLLVVSHDRAFLDNVVTSVVVFEAGGEVQQYVGGYTDWATRGRGLRALDNPNAASEIEPKPRAEPTSRPKNRKLSYNLQRELDALPDRIEALEQAVQALEARSSAPEFYSQPYAEIQGVLGELSEQQQGLERAMNRWAELESLRARLDT